MPVRRRDRFRLSSSRCRIDKMASRSPDHQSFRRGCRLPDTLFRIPQTIFDRPQDRSYPFRFCDKAIRQLRRHCQRNLITPRIVLQDCLDFLGQSLRMTPDCKRATQCLPAFVRRFNVGSANIKSHNPHQFTLGPAIERVSTLRL